MVGSVGMVRGISHPGSLVIQEALNLLSALGSGSEGTTKKLLTEMKSVQDHNEVVLADAKAVVVEADRRETEVVEKEVKLAQDLREAEGLYAGRLSDIIRGAGELQQREEEVNTQISRENEAISAREDKFNREKEEHIVAHSKGLEFLVERERILKEDRDALKEFETSLKGREEEIKSDEIALDDLRDSLDERKIKLDKRDARMRAAMEGEAVVEGR